MSARSTLIAVTSMFYLFWSALVDASWANQLVIGRRLRGHVFGASSDLHAEDCDDADVGWLA